MARGRRRSDACESRHGYLAKALALLSCAEALVLVLALCTTSFQANALDLSESRISITDPTVLTTAETALTAAVETTPPVLSSQPASMNLGVFNTYQPSGIEEILGRKYEITKFTWDSSSPRGTMLAFQPFPDIFTSIPQWKARLNGFQMFRADVRIFVSVSGPPTATGQLMCSWLPCYDATNSGAAVRHVTERQRSWNKPVLISAQTRDVVVMERKWCAERIFQSVPHIGTSEAGVIGTLFIHVLWPFNAVSSTLPEAKVVVSAQLFNIAVQGWDPTSLVPEYDAVFARQKLKYLQTRDLAAKEAQAQGKTRRDAPTADEPAPQGERPQPAEAKKVAGTGILSSIGGLVANTAPMLRGIPVIGEIAEVVGGVANVLTPIFSALGLEKPDAVGVSVMQMPDNGREGVFVSGVQTGLKMTGRPDAYVRAVNNIFGDGPLNPSVLDLARHPGLYRDFTITEATAADSKIFECPVVPCDPAMTDTFGTIETVGLIPIDVASRMYAYWRGSIKYMFMFNQSAFSACRIRIALFASGAAPASLANVSGDIPSIEVQISGDTIVPLSVAFLYEDAVARTGTWSTDDADWNNTVPASETPAAIGVYLMAPPTTQLNGTTPTNCTVWKAAGTDFQLVQPIGKFAVPSWSATNPVNSKLGGRHAKKDLGKPTAIIQCDVLSEFSKSFPGIAPSNGVVEEGLVSSEELVSIAELGRRFNPLATGTGTSVVVANPFIPSWLPGHNRLQFGTPPSIFKGIDLLMSCFIGYRGGMRIGFSAENGEQKYTLAASSSSGDQTLAGVSRGPLKTVTYPYSVRSLYMPVLPTVEWHDYTNVAALWGNIAPAPGWSANLTISSSSAYSTWIAMGDDGTFGHIMAPPPIKRTQV